MSEASSLDLLLLRTLRKLAGNFPVRLALGPLTEPQAPSDAHGTIRIADRLTLAKLLLNPEIAFGDGYSDRRIEVEGDLVPVLEHIYRAVPRPSASRRILSAGLRFLQKNTPRGSRRNIHRHYDLGNEFYRQWLDPELVYTCAYFPEPQVSLEQAQRAKMDLVCRKLCIKPGETVVEAGCGWGALALHMARYCGVRVKAFNVSHEQIKYARERAQREGLSDRVEFVEDDYRNITGRFDAFMSVGMLEHVGPENYRTLGDVIHRSIGDKGRALLHFIGRSYEAPLSVWIRKRIFPGAYPPTLRLVMDVLEPHAYSVLDIENLRLHYARTLEHWLDSFNRSYEQIAQQYGTRFARMWRLYLAGSIAGFTIGTLQLFQVVIAGRACQAVPWTRAYLYDNRQHSDEPWIPAMS